MMLELTHWEIVIRLALTVVCAALIGWDRGVHGANAGLRTNILVCLASSMSMLLANALLGTESKTSHSFVNIDVMRLPLGVLTGIGFIGAGAIMQRGEIVRGVTTAATLWFVTLMGLCFGAGEHWLGLAMFVLGMIVLKGLKWCEKFMESRLSGTLGILIQGEALSEQDVLKHLKDAKYGIAQWSIVYEGDNKRLQIVLNWRALELPFPTPPLIAQIRHLPGVTRLSWKPHC